ncbi:MAG: SPOR domain-containing protein [Tannerellaceae bacterium]|jgi:hypothetical protein|nr:SPOR domain-containing protein [Tannerellaceae bacterium]
MQRITTHIERLLLTHDCVIIPGIGGFVLQTVPSVYRKENHTFSPMRKELVFNKALQHNDSLLAGSYMQAYRTDYRKAQSMLEEDIAEMKSSLQQYGKISLGTVGSLMRGEEGQLIFQAGKAGRFDVNYYGLPSFHFPSLPPADTLNTVDMGSGKKDTLYIPVSMRFIRGAVAAVAAIALFFLISTPVEDVKQSAYTAAILPTEIFLPETANTTDIVQPEEEEESVAVVEAPAQPPVSGKMYHIIIGSFPDREKADQYMAGVDKYLYRETGIVVRDNRYRVYVRKFDNRQDAEEYLSVIREGEKHKDAWLFISK